MNDQSLPREMCSILFIDLVSSTDQAAEARRQGEEEAHNLKVDRWCRYWQTELEARGATFARFTGDGLIATFQDPLDLLVAVVHGYKALDVREDLPRFPARYGLHVGAVNLRPDGDIIGAEAAAGQRIMSFAPAGQILASGAFAEQVRPVLPSGVELRYVGERRLKGFGDTPTRLYRVCAPGLPDLSIPIPLSRPSLPTYFDTIIGRKRERRELHKILNDPKRRLVTLWGAPGCGKTRLAAQVAHEVQTDFADGVYFVALEETSDVETVLSRIATTLSVPLIPGADAVALISAACRDCRLLVVLDNFEQALSSAGQVSALLQAIPGLHVLVTSRDRLLQPGEQVYALDPLATPARETEWKAIKSVESVKLFVERARAANSRFKLTEENADDVAWLCRQLDGLPLALEILAAEAYYAPVAQIKADFQELLHRQTDESVLPRHRSLRVAYDHSYERLLPAEQRLFCELGLFETPVQRTRIFDVCTGQDLDRGLRLLQDKSLVHCDVSGKESRYHLLIPAREYARFRLGEADGALRQRFISTFTRRAETLRDSYMRSEAPEILLEIHADLDNYRRAWRMALDDNNMAAIADLGMALIFFAPVPPFTADIAQWVEDTERALARLTDVERPDRIKCLGKLANTRARLENLWGNFVKAVDFQQEALYRLENYASEEEIADAQSTVAFFALRAMDYGKAEHHAQQAIKRAQSCGAINAEAFALYVLACIYTPHRLEQATQSAERSLALFQQGQDSGGVAHALAALAGIAAARGQREQAESHYRASLRIRWEYRAEDSVARLLETLGKFHAGYGNIEQADYLLLAAANAQRALGMPETARLSLSESARLPTENDPPTLKHAVARVLNLHGEAE